MNWMMLAVVLIAWCAIGFGVAYLFGRFISGIETPDNSADESAPSVVSYLRRGKHAKPVTRPTTQSTKRRASGG